MVLLDHITVTLTLTVTGSFFSLAKGRDDRQTHKATYSWSGLVFLLTEAIPVTAKDGSGGHPNEETNRNTEKKKYCFGWIKNLYVKNHVFLGTSISFFSRLTLFYIAFGSRLTIKLTSLFVSCVFVQSRCFSLEKK